MRTRAIVTKNTNARANRERECHLLSAAITDISLSLVKTLEKNKSEIEGEREREILKKKKYREKKGKGRRRRRTEENEQWWCQWKLWTKRTFYRTNHQRKKNEDNIEDDNKSQTFVQPTLTPSTNFYVIYMLKCHLILHFLK